MKKVYVFYIATTSCLFLALFAVFALAGLGGTPETPDPPPTPAGPPPTSPPVVETAQLTYPNLLTGVMYSVSHRTTISADPEGILDRKEELPPAGIFLMEGRENSGGDLWYRITVNNGSGDYPMYLKAEDLNWQNVLRVRSAEMQASLDREEILARMRETFGIARKEIAVPEPEPEPTTTERVTAMVRNSVTNMSSQGLLTTALVAIVTTFAIVFTIGILVWLYTTRRWQKSSLFDELESERGEEFYEEAESGYGHGDES